VMPDPIEKPTLTVDEVAPILGVSRSTAYEVVRSGQIPVIRLNARWLVPTAALKRWLDEQKPTAEPAKSAPIPVRRD
jgi:excisionase family DNA binding protein